MFTGTKHIHRQLYISYNMSGLMDTHDQWKQVQFQLQSILGQSESVYRRRTDNTMAKRKTTK
jgi:hypothetical protein